jgi:hypothetical protein
MNSNMDPAPPESEGQPGKPEQRKPPRPPVVIRVFRYLKRREERRRHAREQYTGHERNERTMAKWTRNVGIFNLLLVIIAAVTARILWMTMMDARTANAPILAFTHDPNAVKWVQLNPTKPGHGRIVWRWVFANVGKGTAVHVHSKASLDITGKWLRTGTYDYATDETLPPGAREYADTASLDEMTKDDFENRIITHEFSVTLHVTFWYEDVYGNQYETTLCGTHLSSGDIANCQGGVLSKVEP